MKSVYFAYQTTTQPYGGVNSFNRALQNAMADHPEYGFKPEYDSRQANLIFLSAASRGPDAKGRDRVLRPWQLRNLIMGRRMWDPRGWSAHLRAKGLPLIHRLDGLTVRYGRRDGSSYDDLQQTLNGYADRTIFQSTFCRESFRQGKNRATDSVVLNGVDGNLFPWKARSRPSTRWKTIATSWSSNPVKGHEGLARLSLLPNLDVTYIGRWPVSVAPQKVRLVPAMTQTELVAHYHEADFFVHLAAHDPAPNVVVEALAAGLPVLYLASGGTPELCADTMYGVAVKELSVSSLEQGLEMMKNQLAAMQERVGQDRHRFLIESCLAGYAAAFKVVS